MSHKDGEKYFQEINQRKDKLTSDSYRHVAKEQISHEATTAILGNCIRRG